MYPPFTPADVAAIERFVEAVLKRQGQISSRLGIGGSYAKALHDVLKEVRMDATKRRNRLPDSTDS